MKKISLIIPCYNCEKTIKRCLDSVFSQDYKNLEVLVINDGSTDNTLELLSSYAQAHENLKIFDRPNKGVSSARNLGLREATGDYIEFLDSDDNFLYPDVLTRLVEKMESSKADMVVFNFTHPCFESHLKGGLYDLTNEQDFMTYYQDFFASSLPWNRLIKKELITEKFDEDMCFAEDEIFNLKILKNIKKLYYIEDVLYNYYCAPPSSEKPSLINRLYSEKEFWNKKSTIFYSGLSLMPRRQQIYDKEYPEKNLKYLRPLEFFLFDFAFMNYLNIPLKYQFLHCQKILQTKIFKKILIFYRKNNLILKLNLKKCMKNFVKSASACFREIKRKSLNIKIYPALFAIFANSFYDLKESSRTQDLLEEALFALKETSLNMTKYIV